MNRVAFFLVTASLLLAGCGRGASPMAAPRAMKPAAQNPAAKAALPQPSEPGPAPLVIGSVGTDRGSAFGETINVSGNPFNPADYQMTNATSLAKMFGGDQGLLATNMGKKFHQDGRLRVHHGGQMLVSYDIISLDFAGGSHMLTLIGTGNLDNPKPTPLTLALGKLEGKRVVAYVQPYKGLNSMGMQLDAITFQAADQ